MTAATPGRDTEDRIRALWRRVEAGDDPGARDGLILHYAALVKYVAGRVGAGLPTTVDGQDLVSYGMFGLIDAVDRFDPALGVRFEAYAATRIRGAIIDELRRLDWVPRRVRSRARRIAEHLGDLEQRLERSATETELAADMGIEVAELRRSLDEVAAGGIVGLNDLAGGDEERPVWDVLADPAAPDPGQTVADDDLQETLMAAIRRLPERERHVVALYYFESMTLGEIGEVLGVTESRISQIHAKAVLSLRNRMTAAAGGR